MLYELNSRRSQLKRTRKEKQRNGNNRTNSKEIEIEKQRIKGKISIRVESRDTGASLTFS
jgi:hypothetical protein